MVYEMCQVVTEKKEPSIDQRPGNNFFRRQKIKPCRGNRANRDNPIDSEQREKKGM